MMPNPKSRQLQKIKERNVRTFLLKKRNRSLVCTKLTISNTPNRSPSKPTKETLKSISIKKKEIEVSLRNLPFTISQCPKSNPRRSYKKKNERKSDETLALVIRFFLKKKNNNKISKLQLRNLPVFNAEMKTGRNLQKKTRNALERFFKIDN